MAELLIEIGTEEMPAPWLPGLAEQLHRRFTEGAAREHLLADAVRTWWTPRRLALGAEIPDRQPDREESVWGPSLKVARDASGRWTGAAQGFARKQGIAPDALREAPRDPLKPEELYLLHVRSVAGRPSPEVVRDLLPGVLRGLAFPKRMSWDAWLDDGRGAFPFGRPIRWLAVLVDEALVPFEVHGTDAGERGEVVVRSAALTRGHRFLPRERSGSDIPLRSAAEWKDRLAERFVIVDPAERLARIDTALESAARGVAFDDHGLREEWRDLVEYPSVLTGEVPAEFRSLPLEVLETVLVHHQKYVPLRGNAGRVERFAAVVNGEFPDADEIVRGMQRVVIARLRDATFFVAEDRKRPLADRTDDLAGVTFHKGLGTYLDKALRLERLVGAMADEGLLDEKAASAAREAGRLAKADLTTLMVREFPELQGVMGGLYLEAEGAADDVATAVRWHYHPVAVEPEAEPAAALSGRDRAARVFAAVALADKLDTLAGYFGLGESPTGSRDPFGLRRAGQGAIRVILDFWRPRTGEPAPDLQALVAAAVEGYSGLEQDTDATRAGVEAFLLDRLEYVAQARGFSSDEVAAVVHAPDPEAAETPGTGRPRVRALADPLDCLRRLQALQGVRREVPEDFAALAEAFKRAKNILAQQGAKAAPDPDRFEEDAERELHAAAMALAGGSGSYEDRLRGLARLRAPVGRFFDDVLVMAEDPRVRDNRLALLSLTLSLFYRIADISKLGGTS
jgi:glycyl-tRNA synthetase beta chain